MLTLFVVRDAKDWPLQIPGVKVVSSRDYLTQAIYADLENTKVFNLSRSYAYQNYGYYVSLLASARGHRPVPDITAIQDVRSTALNRVITSDLEDLIQKSLREIQTNEFELSIYFGRNLAKKYDRLAMEFFNLFRVPLLRVVFSRKKDWQVRKIKLLSGQDIPETHRAFVLQTASVYLAKRTPDRKRKATYRYDLAILVDPKEKTPPSDDVALKRFIKAAASHSMRAEIITREDFARLGEYDALFIRATTQVNNFTYLFARRAQAEGLAVIDDPQSIIRCSNKVFLAESLERKNIPAPKTIVFHRRNLDRVRQELTLPVILKLPDSSFSLGVKKFSDWLSFEKEAHHFFFESDLLIAQEYLVSDYDWRIGVLDKKPLFACKYFMVPSHWQVIHRTDDGKELGGKVKCVPMSEVPEAVVAAAVSASNMIGSGLYGVDIKEKDGKVYVIEVNDNPNVEGGYEDKLIGMALYNKVIRYLISEIEIIRKQKYRELSDVSSF